MFVDKVRSIVLTNIKRDIMRIAECGGHEYIITRPFEQMELKTEIQWLKDNGFDVTEKRCNDEDYYPNIVVRW